MTKIIVFNKPYGVISQFSPNPPHATLKDYILLPDVYPAGRLDADSEGLMILTDNGKLQAQISDPKYGKQKTYWALVEGTPNASQLRDLQNGIDLGGYITARAQVKVIMPPDLWERVPQIRYRKTVPTAWLELTIYEGKNRQIRRMTAKVGLPTLRLVRVAIGGLQLGGIKPGQWVQLSYQEFTRQFNGI